MPAHEYIEGYEISFSALWYTAKDIKMIDRSFL